MSKLAQLARTFARDWTNGLLAARDVLRWGQAYPRRVSPDQMRRMKQRLDEEPTP